MQFLNLAEGQEKGERLCLAIDYEPCSLRRDCPHPGVPSRPNIAVGQALEPAVTFILWIKQAIWWPSPITPLPSLPPRISLWRSLEGTLATLRGTP